MNAPRVRVQEPVSKAAPGVVFRIRNKDFIWVTRRGDTTLHALDLVSGEIIPHEPTGNEQLLGTVEEIVVKPF